MNAPMLQLGPDLAVPADVVTQAVALVAVRRAGKSNAAAVMAEEMFHAGLPWVAIDPKGDWWGLRSNAAGDGPGLPVPIFGGLHGDLPLAAESGRLMAELAVEHNLTCVLDVSRFTKAGRTRFLTDYALRLYELHQADPHPRHVFLEEADRALPQMVRADMAPCVGAWSDLVRLGGAFGLGVTLISQRCAVINKDALTQVELMIALRTTSPQDRKAIHDWMEHHAIATEIVESLPSLLSGEAWVSSSYFLPEHGYEPIQRVRFRQRATYDSGATPKVGERRQVATLADIDLGALEARMAAVVDKATQDDPKALKQQIAELKRQLAERGPDPALASVNATLREDNAKLRAWVAELEAREPERVEVPVLTDAQMARFDTAFRELGEITRIIATAAPSVEVFPGRSKPHDAIARSTPSLAVAQHPVAPNTAGRAMSGQNRPPAPAPSVDAQPLGKAQRAILTVLAQFPAGRTPVQIAMLTGYSSKGGSFRNALGALRTGGLIGGRDHITATTEGLTALGATWEPLPTGPDLLEHWVRQLGKAEGLILRAVADVWPQTLTPVQIAEATGYAAGGGGFRNALGRLRTLLLITGRDDIRVADEIGEAANA